MADWDQFSRAVKQSVWGTQAIRHDEFYHAKFDSNGDVIPGWNAEKWILGITEGAKFSNRNARTVTNPRDKK